MTYIDTYNRVGLNYLYLTCSGVWTVSKLRFRDRINPNFRRCDRWWETDCYYNHFSLLGCSNHHTPAKLLWQALAQSSCYLFSHYKTPDRKWGEHEIINSKETNPSHFILLQRSKRARQATVLCSADQGQTWLGKNFSLILSPLWWHNFKEMFMKWCIVRDCAPVLISSRSIPSLEKTGNSYKRCN